MKNRRILLPRRFHERLKTLSRLRQETSGVLLYRTMPKRNVDDLIVDSLYMTGRGGERQVEIEAKRQRVIDYFLRRMPTYSSIEWHTHPAGSTQPSPTDVRVYTERIKRDPSYIAMIQTRRQRTLIQGKRRGKLTTTIITDTQDSHEQEEKIGRALENCAIRLGFGTLPRMRATLRRR